MLETRLIEIDIAGGRDLLVSGSSADECRCGKCSCADTSERAEKGGRAKSGYCTELMLIPVVEASVPTHGGTGSFCEDFHRA